MSRTKKLSDHDLLLIAFDVIAREGFSSFTFEQVGKAVGLSPAALVKRFKNKKQLTLLARNTKWDQNLGQMRSRELHELSGLQGIYDFIGIISRSVNSKRLGEHAIWLGTEACHPKSKKKVAAYFETTRNIFRSLIEQAIARGELSKSIDPKPFSHLLEALVQGAIFQFAFMDERSVEIHLRDYFVLILRPFVLAPS